MNKEYSKSIKLYERAKIYTPNEYLYSSLGDSYPKVNDYLKAEEEYLHASFLSQNKLYSLYLLAKMYDKAGKMEEAYRTSGNVLNKRAKVESEAVEEILEEMNRLLEKYANAILRE